jgi:hypothetical protein
LSKPALIIEKFVSQAAWGKALNNG